MAGVSPRLETSLRQIASWAVNGDSTEKHSTDEAAQLFDYRNQIGRSTAEDIAAILRAEVERESKGRKTVRLCPPLSRSSPGVSRA